MDKYIDGLIEQFKLATGIKNVDVNSKSFLTEFNEWLKNRKKIGLEYIDLLKNLEFNFTESNCAEVGKGKFDSLVLPYDTTLITRASQISGVDSSRIVNGKMRVSNSRPYLITRVDGVKQVEKIPRHIIGTYMTQNPISKQSILGWENLHNSERYSIILGIYGNTYDRDIKEKINMLESFRDKMISNECVEDYVLIDDIYLYVIGSLSAKVLSYSKALTKTESKSYRLH